MHSSGQHSESRISRLPALPSSRSDRRSLPFLVPHTRPDDPLLRSQDRTAPFRYILHQLVPPCLGPLDAVVPTVLEAANEALYATRAPLPAHTNLDPARRADAFPVAVSC